jgi:hypothetical protein
MIGNEGSMENMKATKNIRYYDFTYCNELQIFLNLHSHVLEDICLCVKGSHVPCCK